MRREKKYIADRLGGKKLPAHQVARKKILLTRNHPSPPPSRVKWSAPNSPLWQLFRLEYRVRFNCLFSSLTILKEKVGLSLLV